jgi:hypothetical protein
MGMKQKVVLLVGSDSSILDQDGNSSLSARGTVPNKKL